MTTTQELAQQYLGWVLDSLDDDDPDEGIDSGYVYSHETGAWDRFMLAGNGPTVYAYFLFNEEDEIDHGYIEYCEWTGNALAVVPTHRQDELLAALRHSVATGIERRR